jgi:hypothetical protein
VVGLDCRTIERIFNLIRPAFFICCSFSLFRAYFTSPMAAAAARALSSADNVTRLGDVVGPMIGVYSPREIGRGVLFGGILFGAGGFVITSESLVIVGAMET